MRAHETEAAEILAGERLACSEPFIRRAMMRPTNSETLGSPSELDNAHPPA